MKIWNAGDEVDASDLNANFAESVSFSKPAGYKISAGDSVYFSAADVVDSAGTYGPSSAASATTTTTTIGFSQVWRMDSARTLFVSGGNAADLKARVGQINTLETDFTYGTAVSIPSTGLAYGWDMCQINATTFAIIFNKDSAGSAAGTEIRIISISGTTITLGTALVLDATGETIGNYQTPSVAFIDSTHVIAFYRNVGSTKLVAQVLSLSGTTLSTSTAYDVDTTSTSSARCIETISATHAIAMYQNTSSKDAFLRVIDISGTVLTVNSAVTAPTPPSVVGASGVFAVNSSTIIFTAPGSNSLQGMLFVGSISGSTLTVPLGSYSFIGGGDNTHALGKGMGISVISDTLIIYYEFVSGSSGTLHVFGLSGTTLTNIQNGGVTTGSPVYGSRPAKIKPMKWAVMQDNAGAMIPRIISMLSNAASKVGVANSTVAAGATESVTYIGRILSGFTGLVFGTQYYIDDNGQPTTESSLLSVKYGVAVSTTEMLLQ